VRSKVGALSESSDLADSLDSLAERIDSETHKISGGFLLIGGVVALVNPLVGVGIAAKGLLPSIGTQFSKAGIGYLGDKLRKRNKNAVLSKTEKNASAEVKRLKPLVYTNSIIRSLDAIASNPDADFDPSFDSRNWSDNYDPSYYYTVTQEAITEVYKQEAGCIDLTKLERKYLSWIKSIIEG